VVEGLALNKRIETVEAGSVVLQRAEGKSRRSRVNDALQRVGFYYLYQPLATRLGVLC
jgi:hypothetical protein